jgi:hypothetical protein
MRARGFPIGGDAVLHGQTHTCRRHGWGASFGVWNIGVSLTGS